MRKDLRNYLVSTLTSKETMDFLKSAIDQIDFDTFDSLFTKTDVLSKFRATSEKDNQKIVVKIDAPGYGPEDIAVSVTGKTLNINSARDTSVSIYKAILPEYSDKRQVQATVKHGVITIIIPHKKTELENDTILVDVK